MFTSFTLNLITSDCKVTLCQTVGLLVNNEIERMRNGAVVS